MEKIAALLRRLADRLSPAPPINYDDPTLRLIGKVYEVVPIYAEREISRSRLMTTQNPEGLMDYFRKRLATDITEHAYDAIDWQTYNDGDTVTIKARLLIGYDKTKI